MNSLQRALVEKAGHDNGFEHVVEGTSDTVVLASALHCTLASVFILESGYRVTIKAIGSLSTELSRSFPHCARSNFEFDVKGDAELAALLKRASGLSRALPNQPANDYEREVARTLSALSSTTGRTEVERLVRQRIGQHKFREALFTYWGGVCAVTGISVPEVLRASHAKPWAECETDKERLDVFNGFLLCANLDALFDRHLISFDEKGSILISQALPPEQLHSLGIAEGGRLRWVAPEHERYLRVHRLQFKALCQLNP
jgi:putative restriction endonuclease